MLPTALEKFINYISLLTKRQTECGAASDGIKVLAGTGVIMGQSEHGTLVATTTLTTHPGGETKNKKRNNPENHPHEYKY